MLSREVADMSELAHPTATVSKKRAAIIQKANPRAAWTPEFRIR
jgi:hypothetical protein